MSKIHWDTEGEEYECKTTGGNSTHSYCSSWTSFEESPSEWEEGTCSCTQLSSNGAFCAKWKCEQDEYDKCGDGESCNDCDPDGCQYCYNCYGYDSDGYYCTFLFSLLFFSDSKI